MPETKMRQFRITDELIERLDRYTEHLATEQKAFNVTRSSALRFILDKHLSEHEATAPKRRRRKKKAAS
jgi:16S rRNA G527 N7-methylase RsmG